jgi:hypothetical protein
MDMHETNDFADGSPIDETSLKPGRSSDAPPAWEMIENGRYRPRRIKGSCLGRELG